MGTSTRLDWKLLFLNLLVLKCPSITCAIGKLLYVQIIYTCMPINMHVVVMPVATVNLEPHGVLHLCPGSNITFVCTTNQMNFIVWRSFQLEQDYPDGNPCFFNPFSEVDMVKCYSGSFAVVLISASPLISTATLKNNLGSQLNGTNLTCSSTTSTIPSPSNGYYALLILKGTRCIHSLFTV